MKHTRISRASIRADRKRAEIDCKADDVLRTKSTDWIHYRQMGGALGLDEYISLNQRGVT